VERAMNSVARGRSIARDRALYLSDGRLFTVANDPGGPA
jgi:hypothetical protein